MYLFLYVALILPGRRGESSMNDDRIIKQNSPKNILWRLFRIWVEETEVPASVRQSVMEKIGVNQNEH